MSTPQNGLNGQVIPSDVPSTWEKIKDTKDLIMRYVSLDDQAEFIEELSLIVTEQARLDDALNDLSLHVWSWPLNPEGEPNDG